MATSDQRTMKEKYSYFIRGRKICILEWKENLAGNTQSYPDYQPPSATTDALDDSNAGKNGISNGLMLQFTAIPDVDELLTENDILPVNDILSLAMVDYIKAQLVEDPKDQGKQAYYLGRFKDRISKYSNRKVGGLRRVVGNKYMRGE